MTNDIAEAKAGLIALLSAVDGLRVLEYAPDAAHQLPAAIVRLEQREAMETLGGGAIVGSICVEALVSASDARQAIRDLDALMEAHGAQSIEAAASADPGWGGSVDDARLVSIDNIGERTAGGVRCLGADFHFRFVKRVNG